MPRLLPGESPDEAKKRTVIERLNVRRRRLGALKRRLIPEHPIRRRRGPQEK